MRKVLFALVATLLMLLSTATTSSADGVLTGDIPGHDVPGGVALVQWSGGSIEDLQAAADQGECRLRSAWVTSDGGFVGYLVGAPEFVNDDWTSTVGASVEARPLLIACLTPGLDSGCIASGSILDYAAEASGEATPREALDRGVQELSQYPDGAPPEGTFVEASRSEATPESDPTAVFELVSPDGVVIGRYTVVDFGTGWLLSGTHVCYFAGAS